MDRPSLPDAFSQYLRTSPRYHLKLFEILDEIAREEDIFPYALYLEIIHHILSNMKGGFVEGRDTEFFRFLLANFCNQRPPSTICIIKSLLHEATFPFQKKQVLGFFVELRGIHRNVESIQSLFLSCHQEVFLVEGATLPFIHAKQDRTLLYFEIQKKDGEFIPDDVESLTEDLEEITTNLAFQQKATIPVLESSFKTLRWLMGEVQKGDLPHVLIDLCSPVVDSLSFLILLCHEEGPDTPFFSKLLEYPDTEEKMHLKEENKEGIVLKVDLGDSSTLSLIGARNKISERLKQVLGEFRDVNGGLLEKMEENFHALAKSFPRSNGLLRRFFDSVMPEEARATADPTFLKKTYLGLQKVMQGASTDNCTFVDQENWIAVIIKLDWDLKKKWEATLPESFPNICFFHISDAERVILGAFLLAFSEEEKVSFRQKTQDLFQVLQKQKASTQILRLCTTSRFTSFDPRTGTEEETSHLHKMLFEGLTRIGAKGEIEQAISKKIEISADGKHYRFFLRKSTWSNGMPLTAHDFLYSWKMILKRKELAPLSYLFDCIENAKDIKEGKAPIDTLGVIAREDNILDVKLSNPHVPFLEICALALFSPICQVIDVKHPSWVEAQGDQYICNGPFLLEKKEVNGGVVLKKNARYWEANKVKLKQVTIPLVSQQEGKERFLKQEIDALLYFLYKNPVSIRTSDPTIRPLKGGIFTRYLCFNCSLPPFHNKKVRQAIACTIDRQKAADVFLEEAFPLFSFLSPAHRSRGGRIKYKKSIKQAQRLMMEAFAEDLNVRNHLFNVQIFCIEPFKDLAECICNQVNRSLNLNWCTSVSDNIASQELFKWGHQPLIRLYGWVDKINDPKYFLDVFSSTSNSPNLAFWTHPLLQSCIEASKTARTEKLREQALMNAEKLLLEELPMIPLLHFEGTSLCHPYVGGAFSSNLNQFDMRFAFKWA